MKSLAILVAAALLVSCSSTEDPEEAGEQTSPTQEKDKSKPKKPDNCEEVTPAKAKRVLSGAEPGVGKLEFHGVGAVRSPDFEEVYFIAVEFTAAGFDDEPEAGVWASNALGPNDGIYMAVDGFAKEFTVWPDGDGTDAAISGADPSVDAAIACL